MGYEKKALYLVDCTLLVHIFEIKPYYFTGENVFHIPTLISSRIMETSFLIKANIMVCDKWLNFISLIIAQVTTTFYLNKIVSTVEYIIAFLIFTHLQFNMFQQKKKNYTFVFTDSEHVEWTYFKEYVHQKKQDEFLLRKESL